GYSINDTVVIFDRVRENMRKYQRLELSELLNNALNQTLSRTLITSVSTLLALLALASLGGPIIRDFAVAMIWGVAIGSFSSVGLAAPLLLFMRPHRGAFDEGDDASNPKTPAQS
ncbi:MAG: protein translocase subunit SecF, partial [Pseudomonadota bacterium]